MKLFTRKFRLQLLCTALTAAASPAAAQVTVTPPPEPTSPAPPADAGSRLETAPDPAQTAAQKDAGGIGDIVVTAQRRSERLQDVPIAVSAVTAESLQDRGVSSTRDIIAAVPAVTVFSTAGSLQPRIRGIGNTAVGAGFEGGVALYVDGVYQFSPQANLFSLANIDRVEVLKGPQGTLFGRNATGGLIQIITREPSPDFEGTASLTYANYDTIVGDFFINGGLWDGISANLTAHVERQGDGWGTNLTTGRDAYRTYHDVAVRASFLIEPAEGTDIRLTGDYADNRNNISQSTRLAPGTGFPFPGLVQPSRKRDVASDIDGNSRLKAGGLSIHVTQDLGFASLVSISAYRESKFNLQFDGDATNVPLIGLAIGQRDNQYSQELQLASNSDSAVKWVVGAFYFDGLSRLDPNQVSLFGPVRPNTPIGPVTGTTTFAKVGTKSLAGYGQVTVPLGPETNVTGGFRYTNEEKDLTDIRTSTNFLRLPNPVPGAPVADRKVTYNRPTWRASIDHRFSPQAMVYASYNRGFKSGGFNGQFPTDAPFLPEKIDAFEVGMKTDLLNRNLRLNASGFYYDYSNIQVSRFIGSQVSYYNGAAAKLYGLDLDFEARASDRLTFSGGLTVIHDRFTEFPNAIISTQIPTGILISLGSAENNRLPLTADFSGTVSATYSIPIGSTELNLDAGYTYNDGYFTQPDNILRQPAYHLLAFGAAVRLDSGLNGRLWMRNALNEDVFNTLAAGSFASNSSLQAPRTYGVTIGYKF